MVIADHIELARQVFLHLAQSTLQILVHLLATLFSHSIFINTEERCQLKTLYMFFEDFIEQTCTYLLTIWNAVL